MDDPSLRANILERSNVGMGMLVINRAQGLDLASVNDLYRRLRDLEVNSLKRFVGVTAMEPGPFCLGVDPKELLLAATCARITGKLPRFSRALLWHSQELAHLMADYRKPLVCQMSGSSRESGAAMACLASFAGAHDDSEIVVEACFNGLVPFGGMTYVLGSLKWNLGEFLALTGWPVRGSDLVYTGLVQHWLSPEALPFLELTAEKQLEVSEADARALLDEHSLPLPGGLRDAASLEEGDSLQRSFIPLINEAFSAEKSSPSAIQQALEEIKTRSSLTPSQLEFVQECLDRMSKASPLAAHATLRLIREAKRVIKESGLASHDSPGQHGEHGEHGALVHVLRLELKAQQKLLCSKDAILGLHARCMGQELQRGEWSRRDLSDMTVQEVDDVVNVKEPASASAEEPLFAVHSRSEMPLSAHPRLRRYHPDYDPATGLDHDPVWMASETKRWSPDLFAEERRQAVEELLGDSDPALFGLSRWTRVERSRSTI
ncbi:unnamed protein product [Polarella glacialis]|nr:unnamed protein product [Polarella glacialis]